ncbi:bacteriophage abortive infection AbiH family protein [Mitsuokella multacida]|jgi:hypothetical protein|uniref:bacteriophage abortive infection AbiH family protein n=1 Tax=Mitsuokella multacida TaxID=52226 RepID=UPI00242ED114|nr:bacteriophage abortive infection AbiH family protein [Mitsuokella multacida]
MRRKNQLFIIGNGFDKAHGLPTGYEDFYRYLARADADSDERALLYTLHEHIGEAFDENNTFLWNDFEKRLGKTDFQQDIFFPSEEAYNQTEDDTDKDPDYYSYQNIVPLQALNNSENTLPEIFDRWISHVDIHQANPIAPFSEYINQGKSRFFTFNYTETLEELYGCCDVEHIHGRAGDGTVLVGHGADLKPENEKHDMSECPFASTGSMDDIERYLNLLNVPSKLYNAWRKDVRGNIAKHETYFESLNDIDVIYSFGFSYNQIDSPYIGEIVQHLNDSRHVKWLLNAFDKSKFNEYSACIRSWGFKGKIDEFFCKANT